MVGIVTALEGEPLAVGDIASRLGGFDDMEQMESAKAADDQKSSKCCWATRTTCTTTTRTSRRSWTGGTIGLQHDPLLYGAYTLNPFLVSVEMVPMLVVTG